MSAEHGNDDEKDSHAGKRPNFYKRATQWTVRRSTGRDKVIALGCICLIATDIVDDTDADSGIYSHGDCQRHESSITGCCHGAKSRFADISYVNAMILDSKLKCSYKRGHGELLHQ